VINRAPTNATSADVAAMRGGASVAGAMQAARLGYQQIARHSASAREKISDIPMTSGMVEGARVARLKKQYGIE
jgi:hypothetical protein